MSSLLEDYVSRVRLDFAGFRRESASMFCGRSGRRSGRLARGWTYEPPTFYEVNDAVNLEECPSAVRCRYVTPAAVPLPAAETSRRMSGRPSQPVSVNSAGPTGRIRRRTINVLLNPGVQVLLGLLFVSA